MNKTKKVSRQVLNKRNQNNKSKKVSKKHSEITTTINWNELKTYHRNPPSDFFPRSKDVRTKYFLHKRFVKKNFGDINNYITKKYFSGRNTNIKFKLDKNIFPYLIDKNIDHYILWFNPKYFDSEYPDFNYKQKQIVKFLKIVFPKRKLILGNNVIYYENIVANRSVSGVRHIQIFIKNLYR
jgi:hypothetical protein